jgi:hypothetical protein
MARYSTGKRVQRAGATGGGRTYRGQAPANWYAALVLIVVIGLASIAFARYEYQNPAAAKAAVPPKVGQVWFAGFEFSLCGAVQKPPPANPNAALAGLTTDGTGVIQIAPKKRSEAGVNATLGRFVSEYPGMTLTSASVQYPGQKVLRNGETCAAGTPDAGKKGEVQVDYWPTYVSKHGVRVSGDPRSLKLGQNSLVTISFAPSGTTLKRPSGTVVLALIKAGASGATTATTLPTTATTLPTTATTLPSTVTLPTTATTLPKATTPTTAAKAPAASPSTTPTTAAKP